PTRSGADLTRIVTSLILTAIGLPASTVVRFSRESNLVTVELSDGAARIEWLSDSSFRYSRSWAQPLIKQSAVRRPGLTLNVSETSQSLVCATKYLRMALSKHGALITVAEPDGAELMSDSSEPELREGAVTWERLAPLPVRY